jgi:translation initiation factor IF-2
VFVEVSAKKRINLDLLLEMICLVSDIKAPKATPDARRGQRARSQAGSRTRRCGHRAGAGRNAAPERQLHCGQHLRQGSRHVRRSRPPLEEAGPSTPVEVLGLEGMPDAGDTFLVVADRDKAKGIAQYRKMKEREAQLAKSSRVSLEGLAEQIKQSGMKDLPLIIKGDVTGSVEVLADSLQKMSTEKVRVKVLHSGVGRSPRATCCWRRRRTPSSSASTCARSARRAELAQQENVEIRLHSIIYELQDEIRLAMMGLLEPVFKENYAGPRRGASTSSGFPRWAPSPAAACRMA